MGSVAVWLLLLDCVFRRLLLPLALLLAIIFRYNVFSLIYLLFFIVILFIPSPRLKSQKYVFLALLVLLLASSLVFLLGQAFFQFSLLTNNLLACSSLEATLRQIGVIQFMDVPAKDVVRQLLPDFVVVIITLLAVIVNSLILRAYRKVEPQEVERAVPSDSAATAEPISLADPQEGGEMKSVSGEDMVTYDSRVQSYWQVPEFLSFMLQLLIFLFLALAGVAVPSVTSAIYFLSCLILIIIWSLHLSLLGVVRVLRLVLVFYGSAHLVILDLYQFQSAQELIPVEPKSSGTSLLVRLFGLTPVIRTVCSEPSSLHVFPGLHYVNYMSPALILALVWLLATDCRLWLSTPSDLWKNYGKYYLPITDHTHSPPIFVRMKKGQQRHVSTNYTVGDSDGSVTTSLLSKYHKFVVVGKSHRVLEVWHAVWEGMVSLWALMFSISYIFAIVAMMVWSVAFPSWPSLVFLLWACGIWLFPKATPREAVLWTSPLLVLYSTLLLLLQYVYSLDIGQDITRVNDLVPECSSGLEEGCKSWALAAKIGLTVVFYAAFRESSRYFYLMWMDQRSSSTPAGGSESSSPEVNLSGSHGVEQSLARREYAMDKYRGLFLVVGTYWVLVVVGAFLLVFLTGQPGLLKTVYLFFFFYLILTYQVARRCWFFMNFPMWWALIVYAVVHILLVYTYNFEVVSERWTELYNTTNLAERNISESALFTSVGLIKFDETDFRSLFSNLVPLAVFIAVLAIQITYFKPSGHDSTTDEKSVDLNALLPGFVRSAFRTIEDYRVAGEDEEGGDEVEMENKDRDGMAQGEGHGLEEGVSSENFEGEGAAKEPSTSPLIQPAEPPEGQEEPPKGSKPSPASRRKAFQRMASVRRQSMYYATLNPFQKFLINLHRFMSYVWNKIRNLVVVLSLLMWRFLQLHLYKIVMVFLFASCISQISILYLLLLVGVVIITPFPVTRRVMLPLVTLYLGGVALVKMVYQIPLIKEENVGFSDGSGSCEPILLGNASGEVYHHRYSPQGNDANWLGLHKAQDFARYISLPIISALLLTLLFSVERFQEDFYKSKGVRVSKFEKGSLFLDVPRAKAEEAVWPAVKYWINHTFEIYGVEICLCMLAITVSVRVDVYGVFYALALGLLLLVPRGAGKVWMAVWVAYMVVHGCLLIIQYIFLLGIPEDEGYCLTEDYVYPWSNLTHGSGSVSLVGLKKWLFLPADRDQILNRNLLYADFLVYLFFSCQLTYFFFNPLKDPSSDHYRHGISLSDFTKSIKLLDYIKYFVFEYLFWVSLFLVFVTAVARVSILGLVYLLAIFVLLYRGEQMIKDSRKRRKLSWSLLRWFTWAILLLRVSLQIVNCCIDLKTTNTCVLTVIFNGACTASSYYGVVKADSCQASNVGLWVDAFNFAVLTVQIVVMDTRYTDEISQDLRGKEKNATKFRDIFDSLVAERQEDAREHRLMELSKVRIRTDSLDDTGKIVDHILYREVKIPDNIHLQHPGEVPSSDSHDKDSYFDDKALSATKQMSQTTVLTESSEDEEPEPWYSKLSGTMKGYFIAFVDQFTKILEKRSALYRQVVEKAMASEIPSPASPTRKPEENEGPGSRQNVVVAVEPTADDGGTEDGAAVPTDDEEVHSEDIAVEVNRESDRTPELKQRGVRKQAKVDSPVLPATASPTEATFDFDHRVGLLGRHLPIQPSEDDQKKADEYEKKLMDQAGFWTQRVSRLLIALYYMFLSHSEYVVYFFIIVIIILNGGMLSLIYAGLLFCWGLLSNPWPTRVFWLIIIFYSMLVIILKYTFQVVVVIVRNYRPDQFTDDEGGLNKYTISGVQFRSNFLSNTAWDMVLLIALLIHRGLLKQYGLWTVYQRGTREVLANVKIFFKTLVDPNISLGAQDYYVVMLFFDLLSFITLVLGANSFGVGAGSDVAAVAGFIQSNRVPLFFLAMLLLQFLSMLVDRAIYLRHSVRGKLAFQVVLLVGWHVGLFYILPSTRVSDRPFVGNLAAQFLYFFKACYFIVSSLQIVSGYPVRVIGNFLTSSYNFFSYGGFVVYRLIPLLPELREVMDWSFTDTTLSLFNWFRVQEIYAQLFLIKIRRNRESNSPRVLGDKQKLLVKMGLGFLLLTGLVLLIWGPLVFISFVSSTSPPNPPTEVTVRLTLAGFEPMVQLTAQNVSITTLDEQQYQNLVEHFRNNARQGFNVRPLFRQQLPIANFRRIRLKGIATALWTISPPARNLLVQQLQDLRSNTELSTQLEFSWSISRAPQSSAVSEVVSGSRSSILRYSDNSTTIDMFINSLNTSSQGAAPSAVILKELFPVAILAPASGASVDFRELTDTLANDSRRFISTKLKLASMSFDNLTREWWEMVQDNSTSPYILSEEGDEEDENNFIELIVYSSPVPPVLFQSIAALGITGLYSVIVLAIGRLIRGIISDLPSRLIIDEILYPEPLLKLCDDIYLLRECKKFRLEEIYVGKLFNIFRSPEKIIELTEEPKVKTD